MKSSLVVLAAEQSEVVNELPMPPIMYGIISLAIFAAMLMLTFAYRNIYTRR
ncbi:MAG TPA: hypothetical protein VK024_08205 [Actinomycetaceae bacterium]|nr:hypothetical protein [Actinomycetaceae bacterium]